VVVIDCRASYGTTEDHRLGRLIPIVFRNESARLKCSKAYIALDTRSLMLRDKVKRRSGSVRYKKAQAHPAYA
jgi:hypothetical protein